MTPKQKVIYGIIALSILSISFVMLLSFVVDIYKAQNKTFTQKEIQKVSDMEGKTCIATIYISNGQSREFKIDNCSVTRKGGFVQFQSNGKYILLEGTVILEEK